MTVPVPDEPVRRRSFVVALVAYLLVGIATVLWAPPAARADDVRRFMAIASGDHRENIDPQIEFAPLQTLLVRAVFATSEEQASQRLAALSIASGLAIALILRRAWSEGIATTFLALALPMQLFMPFRIDYVPTLFALAAMASSAARRSWSAGGWIGLGVLTKVWPIVLAPVLLLRGQRRALLIGGCVVAGGMVLWTAIDGWTALADVVTFRGARGWHVGSTVGSVVSVVTDSEWRHESGAWRVGRTETWHVTLSWLCALVLVAAIWARARSRRSDPAGLPTLGAVAALIACSPLFSAQYVAWLLPWAAIAADDPERPGGRTILLLVLVASLSGTLAVISFWGIGGDDSLLRVALVVRVLAILGLVVAALFMRAGRRPA